MVAKRQEIKTQRARQGSITMARESRGNPACCASCGSDQVVQALLLGGQASLTLLGRSRTGGAHVKHHVKAVDRLLGNKLLHQELGGIYRAIAHSLFVGNQRPVLAVDWSDFECGKERRWPCLRRLPQPAAARSSCTHASFHSRSTIVPAPIASSSGDSVGATRAAPSNHRH